MPLYAPRDHGIAHQKHNEDTEADQAQAEEYKPDDASGISSEHADSETGPGDA